MMSLKNRVKNFKKHAYIHEFPNNSLTIYEYTFRMKIVVAHTYPQKHHYFSHSDSILAIIQLFSNFSIEKGGIFKFTANF